MVYLSKKDTGLKMVRGSTQELEICVLSPHGHPYVLLDGDVIRFGVKNMDCLGGYLVKKEATELIQGIACITINPEDTVNMEPGRYCYDIGLQSGDHYFPVVKYSEFILEPNVTWKE